MRWEGRVAPVRERRGAHTVLKERDHLKDLDVGGRLILKWIFKKNEMGRACSTCGERSCTQSSEGKRPLGNPRCRWEDNIKMDLKEVGW